ncbi:MAG: DNA-deoxyinosine glycosylase, partial [Candidatus Methanoperedens sp.]
CSSRNCFWFIMEKCLKIPHALPYKERLDRLKKEGIALWDVIESCQRNGSSDKNIIIPEFNCLKTFLECKLQIKKILFNGKQAEKAGNKLLTKDKHYETHVLPSTSNANTGVRPFG